VQNNHICRRHIYFHDRDPNAIETVLNTEFNYLSDRLRDNEPILNLKKDQTEIMLLGTKQRISKATDIMLHTNHQRSIQQNHANYLVKVDTSPNLNEHFQTVPKKASSRLRLLRKT